MTSAEAWDKYLWGVDDSTAIVYRLATDTLEIFVCESGRVGYGETDAHRVVCEISDEFGGLLGQAFECTFEDGVRMAFIDAFGAIPLHEETCCEDAVNVIAYEAYQRIFGECPMFEMDRQEVDELLRLARDFVRRNIRFASFEWLEY